MRDLSKSNILLKVPPQPTEEDPKDKGKNIPGLKLSTPSVGNPMGEEMKTLYNRPMKYDNNRTSVDLIKSVAQKTNIDPAFLYSSAFQEGMNKAIAKPDEVSEAYNKAKIPNGYPIDAFLTYGLDNIGTSYKELVKKGYLPQDFGQRIFPYSAKNEKKQNIVTAAFKNNEDALLAKAAYLRNEMDKVGSYAKSKGVELDPKEMQYFVLASYNGGFGNAQKMLDKYMVSKDKQAFIEKGDANWQKIHKNISPRLQNMAIAANFFK